MARKMMKPPLSRQVGVPQRKAMQWSLFFCGRGSAFGRLRLVGVFVAPAATGHLSDTRQDVMKESSRPKAEVAATGKQTFNEAMNKPMEFPLLVPLNSMICRWLFSEKGLFAQPQRRVDWHDFVTESNCKLYLLLQPDFIGAKCIEKVQHKGCCAQKGRSQYKERDA